MAVYHETLRLSDELRLIITGSVSDVIRTLVREWARAWDVIEGEFAAAIDELLAIDPGSWPSRAQIARATRAQKAFDLAVTELEALTDFAGVLVTRQGGDVARRAIDWQEHLIRSQLPPSSALDTLAVSITWDRLPEYAITAMVERLTNQITSTLRPLTADAIDAMHRALLRGIVVGDNPRQVAQEMLDRVQGAFNGGLTRAMTIARTEILDAYRAGAGASNVLNASLLQGWMWLAQLDSRTCPSCWAMHGTMHDIREQGPEDHQNGRCAQLPITRPWTELGIDGIDEPASIVPDAEATFWAMSRADQLKVMGPTRLAALEAGAGWDTLAVRQTNAGWRHSYVPTPARVLGRSTIEPVEPLAPVIPLRPR